MLMRTVLLLYFLPPFVESVQQSAAYAPPPLRTSSSTGKLSPPSDSNTATATATATALHHLIYSFSPLLRKQYQQLQYQCRLSKVILQSSSSSLFNAPKSNNDDDDCNDEWCSEVDDWFEDDDDDDDEQDQLQKKEEPKPSSKETNDADKEDKTTVVAKKNEEDQDKDQDQDGEEAETTLANNNSTNATTTDDNDIPDDVIVGIGGKDGFSYDVNKLKRNRVQEALRGYKEELLQLLGSFGTNFDESTLTVEEESTLLEQYKIMDDKILGLVQMNPVSTTTDSNLLEGQWTFVYASEDAAMIMDAAPFLPASVRNSIGMGVSPLKSSNDHTEQDEETTPVAFSVPNLPRKKTLGPFKYTSSKTRISPLLSRTAKQSKQKKSSSNNDDDDTKADSKQRYSQIVGEPWRMIQNTEGIYRTSTRDVCLEEVDENEDPYILDRTSLFGNLLAFETKYKIRTLTRKSLQIHPMEFNMYFLKKLKWKRKPKMGEGQIQVLYLDSDVCICRPVTGGLADDCTGMEGPLLLYTKSEVWVSREERKKRKDHILHSLPTWIKTRIKMRMMKKQLLQQDSSLNKDTITPDLSTLEQQPQRSILIKAENPNSSIAMLNIGEIKPDREPSWDAEVDPFANLSLEERQEKMKSMSIAEIEKAGEIQRLKAAKIRAMQQRTPKRFFLPPKPQDLDQDNPEYMI